MSYWITSFNGVSIPTADAKQDLSGFSANPIAYDLPGGGVSDYWGSDRFPVIPTKLMARGVLFDLDPATLMTSFQGLQRLNGIVSELKRTTDAGDIHTTLARMVDFKYSRGSNDRSVVTVEMEFEPLLDHWYGDLSSPNAAAISTSSTWTSQTVTNSGNIPVKFLQFEADLGSVAGLTEFRVRTYEGTTSTILNELILSSLSFPLNSGTLYIRPAEETATVLGNTLDYAVTFSNRKINEWSRLGVGDTKIEYYKVSNNPVNVRCVFHHAWA